MLSPLFITIGGSLCALDPKTGTALWETALPSGRSQLCAHGDRLYIVVESGQLFVVNAQDGKILQQSPISGSGQAPTILIDQNQVFISYGGEVQAFDLDGTLLWTNTFKGKGNGSVNMATANIDRQADEY